jgi:DnaJ-domain-containing protein 1
MPYILLIIGLVIAGASLYRFFLKASAKQVKALLLSILALAIFLASIILAVSGRLPAAIAILVALWPLAVSWLRNKKKTEPSEPPSKTQLTIEEAYEVLGLSHGASTKEIQSAYINLMKKLHPDQAGSDWIAKKINAAKELLLNSNV